MNFCVTSTTSLLNTIELKSFELSKTTVKPFSFANCLIASLIFLLGFVKSSVARLSYKGFTYLFISLISVSNFLYSASLEGKYLIYFSADFGMMIANIKIINLFV